MNRKSSFIISAFLVLFMTSTFAQDRNVFIWNGHDSTNTGQLWESFFISQGSFFQNGQNSIFLYEINTEAGAVQINTTLLDGDNPAVSGTGDLAELQVKLLQAGTVTINFNGSDAFIGPENNDITILEKINGLVVTE
tara:strand:- start:715 stop:1125 length:411 start_codon:yes stop_codon:yes gene_type:complete